MIDEAGNEYCEHCGQDIRLSPELQRADTLIKVCLLSGLFIAGLFVGVML